ncbi:hypothetical protein J3F84DRAFT_139301 [Trichoderma pleuroticola]
MQSIPEAAVFGYAHGGPTRERCSAMEGGVLQIVSCKPRLPKRRTQITQRRLSGRRLSLSAVLVWIALARGSARPIDSVITEQRRLGLGRNIESELLAPRESWQRVARGSSRDMSGGLAWPGLAMASLPHSVLSFAEPGPASPDEI